MRKNKKSAYPTHAVGKAHPVETQGVTNSSQPLMNEPRATGCVAQPSAELLAEAPNIDAGSPSVRKAKAVEEMLSPEEFRKAAVEAYLEDYLNKTGSFSYKNVQVLLIEKGLVLYKVKLTVPLKDVLFFFFLFCDLIDCYVGGVAPKATLLENDTVVYEGVTFGFKWSKEKEEEALNFYTKNKTRYD